MTRPWNIVMTRILEHCEFLSSQCSRILVITIFHDGVITMLHRPCHLNAPEFLSSQSSMTMSSQCYMTWVITVLHDLCHHNALCRISSQFSMSTLITMLVDHFHHISLLSLQFPMAPFFTMLHGHYQHNAPEFFSSQCSMTVSSQCSMALVITMLQNSCHHNVP